MLYLTNWPTTWKLCQTVSLLTKYILSTGSNLEKLTQKHSLCFEIYSRLNIIKTNIISSVATITRNNVAVT